MKSQPEIKQSFDRAFDRTSTREELYQVMELLGGPLSAVAAPHAIAEQKSVSLSLPGSVPARVEQDVVEEADLWDLWNEAEGENDTSGVSDLQPLADLLHNDRQFLN